MSPFNVLFLITLVHAMWGEVSWAWPIIFLVCGFFFVNKQTLDIEEIKLRLWSLENVGKERK